MYEKLQAEEPPAAEPPAVEAEAKLEEAAPPAEDKPAEVPEPPAEEKPAQVQWVFEPCYFNRLLRKSPRQQLRQCPPAKRRLERR